MRTGAKLLFVVVVANDLNSNDLVKAGLVTKTRDAQYRPCTINREGFRDVADWMEQYRVCWEESFDRLGAYLKTVSPKRNSKGKRNVRKK